MTAMRDRVLDLARAELGTGERADGSTKYGSWYERARPAPGFATGAWCQMWCSWLAHQAGLPETAFPRLAYTPYAVKWFKDHGRWGSKPKVGALVYFNFPGGDFVDHVEIVEAIRKDGSIVTIGGNVANAVRRQVRRANIAGYGYPDYGAAAKPKSLLEEIVADLPLLKPGARGVAVKRAFYLLASHGSEFAMDPKVYDDMTYGQGMADRIEAFQASKKLKADREIGPKTWTALLSVQ